MLSEPGRVGATNTLRFRRPGERAWVRVEAAATAARVTCNGHPVGAHLGAWTPFEFELTPWLRADNLVEVRCETRRHVTNGLLPQVGIQWIGARRVAILSAPTPIKPPAPQRSAVRGTQLLVDGKPLRVRGILHWGNYYELGRPWPSEAQMRREITELQALGFNLIKFCLWVPPERDYELCDELGMLVWQEYPVWDTPLTDWAIKDEFAEFFRLDGPHPCVILRTLTCENDQVDPALGRELVDLAHQLIPGALVLDNSAWLCAERAGDFHDEHPYLNNMQWRYYGQRLRGKLSKPLLLGEALAADSLPEGPYQTALAVRRHQIETLARDLPDTGYVVNALRDLKNVPLGLYTADGQPKYTPADWAWHREESGPPRQLPEATGTGPIIGPRKGEWKCPENTWWSPVVKVLDLTLPVRLIEQEAAFELLSGRVLSHAEGTRVLVELWDVHHGALRKHPLVIEFATQGQRRVVSAFRHDTPAGHQLWQALLARSGPAPEIGLLRGDSLVLADWEMSRDERAWWPVKCATPLVNRGRNVFEGWARFRTRVETPGGECLLRCESVGDFYEFWLDGVWGGEADNRSGTWDGARDVPRTFPLTLAPGPHEFLFRVRDWRGGGGMVGPVFLATDLDQRVF